MSDINLYVAAIKLPGVELQSGVYIICLIVVSKDRAINPSVNQRPVLVKHYQIIRCCRSSSQFS